jgi:hypothetical protein
MPPDQSAVPPVELSFVRSMLDTDGKWVLHGEYSIWSGGPRPGEPAYLLHELHENGVLAIPRAQTHPIMHRIAAGTPFEVAHLFGFWISVDVDTVWLDALDEGGHQYALIVGGTQGKPGRAACLWVCPKCAVAFARAEFALPSQRFERFLEFAQGRVRAFNADVKLRTCPRCGNVHPSSYGFDPTLDTEDDKKARQAP